MREPVRYGGDMKPADKVRAILDLDGWKQERLAAELGVSQSTVNRAANNKSDPRGELRDKINALYAKLFDGGAPRGEEVPLKGYIGAGGEVLAESFDAEEMVEAPAERTSSTVAARVRGTSMYPAFHDGWLIYWSKQMPPESLVNSIAVVQLEDDRIMVKTIMRGSAANLWNLISINPETPPMIDQVVRWVAPIDWIKPR